MHSRLPRRISLFALSLVAVAAASLSARATVILDTYPANGDALKPIAIAVPFNPMQANSTITSITAAIRGSEGTVELGIMGDASGLPSDSFLFGQTVTPTLGADVTLSGLDWLLPGAGQFWLAAIESTEFSVGDGFWQANQGLDRLWAFKASLDGAWSPFETTTPAARIEVVPEPSFAWLPAALLFVFLALRRSRAKP